MTSILFEQKPKSKGTDPIIVAFYSIIPGIGQLYNGKTEKGIVFLAATFISLSMLYGSLNPASTLEFALVILTICKFLLGFIFKFDFHPSPAAEFLMNSIKFGGSFSYLLVLTIVSFVIYSMADAYLDAEKNQQQFDYKIISTDSTNFRFSESTASSYILHSIIFILLFLTSLFFVIPTKNKEQITEIEFILPQIESKKPPPETTRRSSVQSIDQGKHIPKRPVTPITPTRPASPPLAIPKVVQMMVATPPKPIAQPQEPKPVPRPVPRIVERPALIQAQPAPIQNIQTSPNQNLPRPAAPAPEQPSTESSSPGAVSAVIPRVPGVPGTGGLGETGNPPPNTRPGAPPSIAAKKDIDFGPYMNELQRRIKRAWRPPRGNESKRVIVIFKISRDGELSNLVIKKGSGFQPSDQAALLAIQNAAPFARLPEGAPSSVDIEFTFDYNVFGATGSYRQY